MAEKIDASGAVQLLATITAAVSGVRPAPNTSLFRYVAIPKREDDVSTFWQRVEDTVLEHKLPLTTPIRLNDPFDSNPVMVNDVSFAEAARVLDGLPGGSMTVTGAKVLDGDRVLTEVEMGRQAVNAVSRALIRRNAPRSASFCRRISSQLLWSHYADSYRGLAYHFVISGSPKSALQQVRPVEYHRQRPVILASEMLDLLNAHRPETSAELFRLEFFFDRKAFLTKSIDWSYEEEERLLFRGKGDAIFEPHELPSIIIGPKFPDEYLPRLAAIVERRSRPLRLYRARLADSDYAIEVDWMHPLAETSQGAV